MGEGVSEMKSLPQHQLQWVLSKQTFEKYTEMLIEWEKSPRRVTNIIWDQSFKQNSLAPLSFPFQRCLGIRVVAVFTDWKIPKYSRFSITYPAPQLLGALGVPPYSCRIAYPWLVKSPVPALSARPLPQIPPSVWAQNGSFLLHIKIRPKFSPSWWPVAYRLTIYNSWSLIPSTYTLILAHSY